MTEWKRIYVSVDLNISSEGKMRPTVIHWPDGREFHIDSITDRRQAAAAKAGGQGDRYTIIINQRERYLFFERSSNLSCNVIGKWYVEKEVAILIPTLFRCGLRRLHNKRGAPRILYEMRPCVFEDVIDSVQNYSTYSSDAAINSSTDSSIFTLSSSVSSAMSSEKTARDSLDFLSPA